MNDKTNVTPLASAKPANGKTPAATQKAPPAAPQASPAVSQVVSGKADAAAVPVAQSASSAAPAASEPKVETVASVPPVEARDASLWEVDAQGGSVEPSSVVPQPSPDVPLTDGHNWRPGERCTTAEKVVFCSGLEALQAVVARPAGTERCNLLRVLMGRGECAILDVGTEIATGGPVRRVTPIGEAPVEAVAATLETGRKGFVLLSGLSAAQTASR